MSNQDRIDAAHMAIEAHRDATRDFTSDTSESVTDLLTSLRHLCDIEDLDFTGLVKASKQHHEHEHEE